MRGRLWAPWAWIDGRLQAGALLAFESGHWTQVDCGVAQAPPDAQTLAGALLPPLVNAHSHAFQRAMVGRAEQRHAEHDDFWSWREAMYGVALTLEPQPLQAWAERLYRELLAGGYTQVVEFHYLQHQPDGQPYDDPLAMSWALQQAAQQVGIGLTLLPVLYAHQGFGQRGLRQQQRRFASDADWVWNACQRLRSQASPCFTAGVALHSLRAAHADDISALLRRVGDADLPIHLHIAEQQAEVNDCLAATGLRPVQWLLQQQRLDSRWQLVHATQVLPEEIAALAPSGAGIVLCPSTEANLGDGPPPLELALRQRLSLSLGSDSQVGREWREELRWLEYGERLRLRQRNVAAEPPHQPSSAGRLFDALQTGGAAAAGLPRWGLRAGARADWLLVDPATEGLEGVAPERWLDALVFASRGPCFAEVGVAGRPVLGPRVGA